MVAYVQRWDTPADARVEVAVELVGWTKLYSVAVCEAMVY